MPPPRPVSPEHRLTFRRVARAAEAHIAEHRWRLSTDAGRLPLAVELEAPRKWIRLRPTPQHIGFVVAAATGAAPRVLMRVHSGRRRESHARRPGHRRTR